MSDLIKRGVDIVGSATLLILLSPLLLLTALMVRINDFGPALFYQRRVGRGGRLFWCLKFRSMVVQASKLQPELQAKSRHKDSRTFKIKNDPRITWIGRIIRKTSIDELPQLWNVLVGDMSLVGPRPALPAEVEQYTDEDRRRLEVRPGLTCFWQVRGRADIPFPIQVQMDIEYIEKRCLWLDLKLILLTIPAVIWGKGAY